MQEAGSEIELVDIVERIYTGASRQLTRLYLRWHYLFDAVRESHT